MSRDELVSVVTTALRDLSTGNLAPLDAHPGFWQSRRYFPVFFAPFAPLAMEVIDQVVEGDTVATRYQLSGVHAGEFMGVAATGRRIGFDAFSIDRVEGGVVTEHNATADLIAVMAQLGIITPRPSE